MASSGARTDQSTARPGPRLEAPAAGDARVHEQGGETDRRQQDRDRRGRDQGPALRVAVQVVGGLHHQPRAAEQGVAGHDAGGDQQGVGGQPVEGPAGETPVRDGDALDETAEDQALRRRRQGRAAGEHLGPEFPAPIARAEAEFEGHAPEDQAGEHQQHRQVEGRHQHRIGQRKRRQKPAAAQHQPGLVAVPDGGDGVHHHVPILLRPGEREQDAEAEVEAVEGDVEQHRDGDQRGPDQRQIKHQLSSPGVVSSGALASGEPGARSWRGAGSARAATGPSAIRRRMNRAPAVKTMA